jgi:hypothetical protein
MDNKFVLSFLSLTQDGSEGLITRLLEHLLIVISRRLWKV